MNDSYDLDGDLDTSSDEIVAGHSSSGDSNTWMSSYSDIVTVLLCFFIIFYSIEKNIEKGRMDDIIADIRDEFASGEGAAIGGAEGVGAGEGKGAGEGGAGTGEGVSDKFPQSGGPGTMLALDEINNIEGTTVLMHDDYVSIILKDKEFFRFSSSKLNSKSRRALKKILARLLPIKDKIRINVRGHTDSVPVTKPNKKAWWKDNMELSLARSLEGRRYIMKIGFPAEGIYVTGEGSQSSGLIVDGKTTIHKDIEGNEVEILPNELERRLTLRIEPR